MQLKRELEDLDVRLMQTNTVNFDEMRTSMLREAINNPGESYHHRSRAGVALEDMRHSLSHHSVKDPFDMRSSVQIYQQIQNNAGNKLNTSHLTQDDVSFDIEKIQAARSVNLQNALETNLKQKKDMIAELKHQFNTLVKE